MTEKFYKSLSAGRKSCHGGDHTWEPGRWYEIQGDLIPCQNGFHFCRPEYLLDWICEEVWETEYEGDVIDGGDKLVARKARITRQCNWTERTARLFAVDCAEDVAHLVPGPETQRCLEVARAYAVGEASYEELAAAREAFWEATREVACEAAGAAAAAREAVWAAGRVTAWAAARDAAWIAARAASKAGTAAWEIANDAAWEATRDRQCNRLMDLLD